MSEYAEQTSLAGYDHSEHQGSYIFVPQSDSLEERPKKRKKLSQPQLLTEGKPPKQQNVHFHSLLNGAEKPHCVELRERLFEDSWSGLEARVESILHHANENTLNEVTHFINGTDRSSHGDRIPTGLITTGPNIAAQDLLFGQLSGYLKKRTDSNVVVLRSSDAVNLRTVLKKLIRHIVNQKDDGDENQHLSSSSGRKLLNYDLEILHEHLQKTPRSHTIIAFQDSEAFDTGLLAEFISLLSSWLDRISFVVLFGIATSVELFHERLPRATIRCLHGIQFDVEQTDHILESIFRETVADPRSAVRLGPSFVTTLLERQKEYVQNTQAFVSALKYAYMCHYHANPLSILLANKELGDVLGLLQVEHFEAIRMLPSFRREIEDLLDANESLRARTLLESDQELLVAVKSAIQGKDVFILQHLHKMHLLSKIAPLAKGPPLSIMEIYTMTLNTRREGLGIVEQVLDSVKYLTPLEILALTSGIESELKGRAITDNSSDELKEWQRVTDTFSSLNSRITLLYEEAEKNGTPLRSRHATQSKALRTTVVAQKVRLSKEESVLTTQDTELTKIVDELLVQLSDLFRFDDPLGYFLHEIWLYDAKSPNREAFMSKPRHAIERALSSPHDYLGCSCCKVSEGLSSSQPPTAILYQLYLEGGGLINVFDLWSAFYTIIGGEEGQDCDERTALMLFYRGLADLKLLGMIKQSRKKTDHLAKLLWRNL